MNNSHRYAEQIDCYTESWQSIGYRVSQEDRFIAAPLFNGHLCAVMDGHGGEEASATVMEHIVADFSREYRKVYELDDSRNWLTPTEERMIIRRTITKLVRRCKRMESGSTLSLVFATPITRGGDKTTVVRIHAATIGDSPLAIWNGKQTVVMPVHSARYYKKDQKTIWERILKIREILRERTLTKDEVPMLAASVHDGYVYTNRNSYDSHGIAMTRAIGDADFGKLLIRRAEIRTYDIPTDSVLLLATDGVLDSSKPESVHERCKWVIAKLRTDIPIDMIGKELGKRDDNTTLIAMRFSECVSYWR